MVGELLAYVQRFFSKGHKGRPDEAVQLGAIGHRDPKVGKGVCHRIGDALTRIGQSPVQIQKNVCLVHRCFPNALLRFWGVPRTLLQKGSWKVQGRALGQSQNSATQRW